MHAMFVAHGPFLTNVKRREFEAVVFFPLLTRTKDEGI